MPHGTVVFPAANFVAIRCRLIGAQYDLEIALGEVSAKVQPLRLVKPG